MNDRPYTSLGKEVQLNGEHFADAIGEKEAKLIAAALNMVDRMAKRKRKTLKTTRQPRRPRRNRR